jgi:2-keto-4-pentenoate hydratase/2-oxohepta-3-ene-1,7-dioic acid hydratase in catechol pathway
MKFMNYDGRLTLVDHEGRGTDVHRASDQALPWEVADAYERWADVVQWAASFRGTGDIEIDPALIGPPSPAPRQMLAVGLNYASHAQEAGLELPEHPMIFPKLHAATAGPFDEIPISTGSVDWEVELAAVIGKRARNVPASQAWEHVAGFTIAQDLSEREIQLRPPSTPQYSLGKSLPGFGPIGPALVTIDELDDPEDLELTCLVNGEVVQRGRTADFIFSIPQIVEYLSSATILYPGDVILTGTPSGIGATRTPPRFLQVGDVLESRIDGLGAMRHVFVAEDRARPDAVLAGREG